MLLDVQVRIAVITAGVALAGLLRGVVMDAVREWRRERRRRRNWAMYLRGPQEPPR
jgi:hypothetical protein